MDMPPSSKEVADRLRADLGQPGTPLPSIRLAVKRYGAGRSAVLQAFEELEREGRIYTTQGKLSQVRDTRRWLYRMNDLERQHGNGVDAWTAAMLAQGAEDPRTEVDPHIVIADPDIADALRIDPERPIISRRRVHYIGGYPHMLSDSYYPRGVTDGHDEFMQPGNVAAPGGLLAATGHRQDRFEDRLATRLPTVEEAATLRMPATIPLLIHTRIGFDSNAVPVRLEVRRMPSDQVEVIYEVPNGGQW